MNDYRVRIHNYDTGEILEMGFDALEDARTYQTGAEHVLALLGMGTMCCDTVIEHRVEKWERVPDESDIITPDDITDEEIDEFADFTDDDGECRDYLSEDGNAPCDNIGRCIGPACPYYFKHCND